MKVAPDIAGQRWPWAGDGRVHATFGLFFFDEFWPFTFHDQPQFVHMNATGQGKYSKMNIPKASRNKPYLHGYLRCWCCGFNDDCGLLRTARTRQIHAIREGKLGISNYSKITNHIRKRSVTLQFLENLARLPVAFLRNMSNEFNVDEHWN